MWLLVERREPVAAGVSHKPGDDIGEVMDRAADLGELGRAVAGVFNLADVLELVDDRLDDGPLDFVERTFARLGRYRRLGKGYEMYTENSGAVIRLAMINIMPHRLSPG